MSAIMILLMGGALNSFFNFLNFILGMAYGFLNINVRRRWST